MLALGDAAALAAYPPLHAGRLESLLVAPGVAACAIVVAVLLFRWEALLPWAVVLLGGAYAASLFARSGAAVDLASPLVGVCLLLLVELAAWSLQERVRVQVDAQAWALRAASLVAVCAVGAAAAYFALATTAVEVSGGLLWEAIGVAAAVAAVALVRRAT